MFLGEPPASETTDAAYAADRETDGDVSNLTRLWCWRPDLEASVAALRASLRESSALTDREWAVLVSSAVAEFNDSYCSLGWGPRLAKLSDDETAAQVLAGVAAPALSDREAALAAWARQVVRDPNSTTREHVARLREVGLGDREIFEATALVAFRLAFSTINDALGAAPDKQLADAAPDPIRAAVSYGRAPSSAESLL
jgi:alkylhydroperoxidase family enzyme